jgi:tetratricopeptide (TPR) repeat protein
VPQDIPPLPSHPLTHIRRRYGWSYQDLARLIADNARVLGVPMAARREKIWRWEHWAVVPERDSQRALARVLGVPQREIDLRPWPRWLPAMDGIPTGLPWSAEGALTAAGILLDDLDDLDDGATDRCGYPPTGGTTLREAATEWGSALAAGPDRYPARRPSDGTVAEETVAEETVAWLESGVNGLRRLDDRLGGAAVRQRAEADLRIAVNLLRRGAYGPGLRARLFRVAADLAQLGGWAATDCGHHSAAQRHFLTGLRLAHCAEDRPLAAGLWAGLSLQAVFADRFSDALAAADAADRAAAHGARRLRAMLATRRAMAHAGLGAESDCRRALDQARSLLEGTAAEPGPAEYRPAEYRPAEYGPSGCGPAEHGPAEHGPPGTRPTDDGPSWLYWFDEAELVAQSGTALLRLGRAEEAVPLLERALAAQDPSYVRDRALYSARAACARMRAGDAGGAAFLAERAAHLGAQTCSPRPAAELASFRR